MEDPLALCLTWMTYGSWLPGDERGRVEKPGRFRTAYGVMAGTLLGLVRSHHPLRHPTKTRIGSVIHLVAAVAPVLDRCGVGLTVVDAMGFHQLQFFWRSNSE